MKLDPNKIYIRNGIGLSSRPSTDIDTGYIGYKGIGEAIIPFTVYQEASQGYNLYDPIKLLEKCIIHSQYIEFKEIG